VKQRSGKAKPLSANENKKREQNVGKTVFIPFQHGICFD